MELTPSVLNLSGWSKNMSMGLLKTTQNSTAQIRYCPGHTFCYCFNKKLWNIPGSALGKASPQSVCYFHAYCAIINFMQEIVHHAGFSINFFPTKTRRSQINYFLNYPRTDIFLRKCLQNLPSLFHPYHYSYCSVRFWS